MGKVRTRILGLEDVEKQQKQKQKKRAIEKKTKKVKEIEEPKKEAVQLKEVSSPKKVKKIKARKRGAKYANAKRAILKELGDKKKTTLENAVKLIKKVKYARFDESIELHININKDGLRGEINLPHPTGKKVRVAVVDDKLIEKIDKGNIDFDVLVSSPSYMPRLTKYAKLLGPRGLMPSPKTATISDRPEEIVRKYEGGLISWKAEVKFPLIHQMIAKMSQDNKSIVENAKAFVGAIGKNNINTVFIKSTMSPSVQLDTETL